MSLNLTTRKYWKCSCGEKNEIENQTCKRCNKSQKITNSAPGLFVKEQNPSTGKTVYKARYSQAYQPEGHDFIKSFKVLRLAYWFEYNLIDQDDIATYETLMLLCEREIPFTLEKLAERMKIGKATLRQRLDNLENAELLDIVESDGQGKPNYYLLRTPYFEKDSLVGDSKTIIRRQDEILFDIVNGQAVRSNRELPEKFLEDHIVRLRRNIKSNRAYKRRRLLRRKDLAGSFKKFQTQLNSEIESKKLVWFSIVKALGNSKAANIDDLIWKLARSGFAESTAFDFNNQLKSRIKGYLKQLDLGVDPFLIDKLMALFHFYAPNIKRAAKPETSAKPPVNDGNNSDDQNADISGSDNGENAGVVETRISLLRQILREKKGDSTEFTKPAMNNFARIVREYGANLPTADVEKVVTEIFGQNVWKQISDEMNL